ncbi:MAG: SBBP repeat-containing protein, partial [Myxococcales bacterium]|nr:SBBP repeat-containing protein [Myxococcales bacterium]
MGDALSSPNGVAVDPSNGNVFVTGRSSTNAFKIIPTGPRTEIIDRTGDGAGNLLLGPLGVAVDSSGNVFVAGCASDNVFKITPGGTITEIIDATGDGAGNTLVCPSDIAVDSSGNVYVGGETSD